MLTEWHNTAAYLLSHVRAGRLELSLVCDIDPEHQYALKVARLAVSPLAQSPPLKDCNIRLCKAWNRPLQRLAEEACFQACPKASPLSPEPTKISSALVNLPPELRLRIFEYTDWITPWKEVSWSRQDHGYQLCHPPCLNSEGGCPPHIHSGCRLSQCSPGVDESPRHLGCFCRRRHAAFSFACNCWAPPTSLFLICRALCRDAQFIFFSGNRFIVHDFHASLPWHLPTPQLEEPEILDTTCTGKYYPYERFAASEFLRHIVPTHCLADLRFLELVFPPYVPHGWPLDEHAPVIDWRATVDWIRGHINAPALSIRVVMADFGSQVKGRQVLTKDQGTSILRGYTRIIHPLRPLARDDALGGFYMQVAYPWRWTQDTLRHIRWHGECLVIEREQDLKESGERYVRGESASSDPPNKAEPRKSGWQRWYEVSFY